MFLRPNVSSVLVALTASALCCHAVHHVPNSWYEAEIDILAGLKGRVTGSPNHNKLIDHIKFELEHLGLKVHTDTIEFTYIDQPTRPPSLRIGGQEVDISSYYPYSGKTSNVGISGHLIDLISSSSTPDWSKASGKIAVLNITNSPANLSEALALWPDQPPWYVQTGNPTSTADAKTANLTVGAEAGVKGVIYVWQHITEGNAHGQYVPFKKLYQGLPTIYVAGDAAETVLAGARKGKRAQFSLPGKLIPNYPTRTIYVIFEGTKFKHESVIINTHTDGTNVIEENGHIAMLVKARDLIANPPERTTILVFVTGHLHQPAFSTKGRATMRWLTDHPEYWAGGPGQMKAVASTCVEHLGAVNWVEDLATGRYYSAGNQTAEILYANTPEIVSLTERNWNGAYPGLTRINNPIPKGVQSGEGEPLTSVGIPNMALVTAPLYLLAEWPEDFDERQLIDVTVIKRQIDSFMRIWAAMDRLPASAFGKVPPLT